MNASRTPRSSSGCRSKSDVISARKKVAEGDVHRRAVVERANAHREEEVRSAAGLLGQEPGERRRDAVLAVRRHRE